MTLVILIIAAIAIYYSFIYKDSKHKSSSNNPKCCPNCKNAVEESFNVCPICKETLKKKCDNCGEALNIQWKYCPYCEKSII